MCFFLVFIKVQHLVSPSLNHNLFPFNSPSLIYFIHLRGIPSVLKVLLNSRAILICFVFQRQHPVEKVSLAPEDFNIFLTSTI